MIDEAGAGRAGSVAEHDGRPARRWDVPAGEAHTVRGLEGDVAVGEFTRPARRRPPRWAARSPRRSSARTSTRDAHEQDDSGGRDQPTPHAERSEQRHRADRHQCQPDQEDRHRHHGRSRQACFGEVGRAQPGADNRSHETAAEPSHSTSGMGPTRGDPALRSDRDKAPSRAGRLSRQRSRPGCQITVSDGIRPSTPNGARRHRTENDGYLRQEIRYGAFRRSLPLPGTCVVDIAAALGIGILESRIPTSEPTPTSKVPIAKTWRRVPAVEVLVLVQGDGADQFEPPAQLRVVARSAAKSDVPVRAYGGDARSGRVRQPVHVDPAGRGRPHRCRRCPGAAGRGRRRG